MSTYITDYIPFDYLRYGTEILPAIERATRGDTTPLSNMIASATHFSPRLRSKYALPLSSEESDRLIWLFAGLFDAPTLHSIRAGAAWNPWEALATVVPTLEGKSLASLGNFGNLLKFHLFATLCCEVPPWSVKYSNPYTGFTSNQWYDGAIICHEEVGFAWHEYCTRDEEMQELWGAFYRPAPPDLVRLLHINNDEYHSRSMHIYSETETEMGINGFMALEEIQHLLEHVRTHERPLLDWLVDECIRDGEEKDWAIDMETLDKDAIKTGEEIEEESWHYLKRQGMYISNRAVFEQWMKIPHHQAEMEEHHMRLFYKMLHMVEDEILHRMRFAAERGWGILVMSAKL